VLFESRENRFSGFLFIIDNRKIVLYNRFMTLWEQLCEKVDLMDSVNSPSLSYRDVLEQVQELALAEDCQEEETILRLLNQALQIRHRNTQIQQAWESLSQREKQVAALVCSGLTGRQIAAQLVLSPETIKTHVRHILHKFGLKSRQDFRNMLSEWDFNRWLPLENPPLTTQFQIIQFETGGKD